ncbi:MAG: TRAP transporter small permease [Alphaproteobacteria bacterium]|nr:TRAP transporter small permease [Alphaproteobacteria bacterium]
MAGGTPLSGGAATLAAADRVLKVVEGATAIVAGVVIFVVMWVGVAEIFLRKAFNSPLYGQLDLIEQTMATYALLTVSYCWRQAGHIRVDLVIDMFRGRARFVVELATTLAALALITAIWPGIYHFFDNAWDIGDSTINTRWPTWPSKSVPVFAFALLWLRLVLEAIGFVRLIADPDATPIAVPDRHHPIEELIDDTAVPPAGGAGHRP